MPRNCSSVRSRSTRRLPPGKERNIWRGNGINNLAVLYGTEANAKAENGQTEGADQTYAKMIADITEVIPLWSKEFGPTHQNISVLLQNRGEAYAKKNQPDRAEADLRQALALRLKYLPAKHPVIATTQNSLANVLVAEKKFPEAEQLVLSALAIRTEALGPNHPSVARNLIALSQLCGASGNTSAAVEYSQKAIIAVINHADDRDARGSPTAGRGRFGGATLELFHPACRQSGHGQGRRSRAAARQ